MSLLWQQMIVYGLLLLSAVYLVVHYIRKRRIKAGCKSCPALMALDRRTRDEVYRATSI